MLTHVSPLFYNTLFIWCTGTEEDCSVQMGVRRAPGLLPLPQQPPPPHQPPLRQRVMGCPTTSAVCSAGRKTRSWENSQPFPQCFMPIPTFPLSNRTTQVSVGQILHRHVQSIIRLNSHKVYITVRYQATVQYFSCHRLG